MRRLLLGLLWGCLLTGGLWAQDPEVVSSSPEVGIEELEELAVGLTGAERRLEELRARLKQAVDENKTEEELQQLQEKVAKQRNLVELLRSNLLSAASGIEEDEYSGTVEAPASLQENLEDIISPISRAMREATEGPRAIDKLEEDLELWESRMELVRDAQMRVDGLLAEAEEGSELKQELEDFQQLWSTREAEAGSQVKVLGSQLEERRRSTPTGWDAVSSGIAEFWRSRGMNLLIALAAAFLVWFLIRRSYRLFAKLSPVHRGKRGFGSRAFDLGVSLLSVILAIFAAVMVFYLRGDWLLMALAVVMLLGIAWASKTAIPPYLKQLKLILNLGPVRQGERLVYEGIPWRVDKLAFFCEFRNPELEGGNLRLPVDEVLGLHSREYDSKEPWFPTRGDDWVKLSDETYGKVVEQTPEQVVVLRLGGSRKTYPTEDFLEQCPENLSLGFRVSVGFGIDYRHQSISTTEVPGIFQVALERELVGKFEHENVRSVKVELGSAGASSLDYEILADFDGAVASRVNVIRRLIQRVCVEVCNEQGWGIPFTQITVHQGE
ncbi:MAG: hypothetical protein AAGI48_02110 [Verrucomicrobiota bacterium]